MSTWGTDTCEPSWSTQLRWLESACAGPARPTTAAAIPLATMVANPNFFIMIPVPSCSAVVAGDDLSAGLMVRTDRSEG